MKISIVTSYFNRKNLLINTLKSISKTNHTDFEFIIVDDASNEENRIEDLSIKFPFVKIIRVEPENKWYINPCVPFNLGFKNATGDIVIIQNPECLHTSDIVSYVNDNLKENDYFVFGCYSLNEQNTEYISNNIENHKNIVFNDFGARYDGDDAWYNHSLYRPVGYHFTSAIFRSKLVELNGFDERYSNGYGYDDNEFLHRLKKICTIKLINNPLVLHQNHYNLKGTKSSPTLKPTVDNSDLFHNTTLKENKIKVNI